MMGVPGSSRLDRLGRTIVNGLEVARFGGLRTTEQPAPYVIVARQRTYRLRRYFADSTSDGTRPPVLLVPPLMLTAEVWDVSARSSAVRLLHQHGLDPWVVDFGDPVHEVGGMRRNVTDHVLAVDDALQRVRATTGRDAHIGGYSQGGLFCYQAAALRRGDGIVSVFALGTPILPATFPLPEELVRSATTLSSAVLKRTGVPGWLLGRAFRFANPPRAIAQELAFLRALHDRDALLPRERQRRFLQGEGWVSWSGPAIAEITEIMSGARYTRGGLVFGERAASLADMTCPVLIFVGESDEYGPPASVRAIVDAAPRAEVHECTMPVGHFGLGVGGQANRVTWPTVADWVRWREDQGTMPNTITRLTRAEAGEGGTAPPSSSLPARVGYGAGLAVQAGLGAARTVIDVAARTATSAVDLGSEAVAQLPRLIRLERIRPHTRISYSLVIEEQARRRPDGVSFMFEDRAYSHADAKRRIDNIVRGLISVGVRRGERVGVLMDTRPSALAVVAALNRIGAVSVLLRPDGPLRREARLGAITRIVVDPEHADMARDAHMPILVLGGGGEPREMAPDVIDMERIDPDAVQMPGWYRPDPGRARDLAFILFSGAGDEVRAIPITNRRWALSAFGAASSAALSSADTIYGVAPLYHPSGLLLTTAAAVAGDARLAMARRFDPETFWSEVRRYGVTIVPYTWAMLHRLTHAPPDPAERAHPVRLFVGSGMPRGVWRAVTERFAPARVVEFYAATQADVILANISGEKVGAMGRPLPGSARLEIAEFDLETGRLVISPDGHARPCPMDVTGMLLVAADPAAPPIGQDLLRGVFTADDAWISTRDLFSRDADGDYWYAGPLDSMIRGEDGAVAARAIEEALGELDPVELAACFPTTDSDGAHVTGVAITLRDGAAPPDRDEVERALAGLDAQPERVAVYVVHDMPLTAAFRPVPVRLRDSGVLPTPLFSR